MDLPRVCFHAPRAGATSSLTGACEKGKYPERTLDYAARARRSARMAQLTDAHETAK